MSVVDLDCGPLLILAKNVCIDDDSRQRETLFNSHHLRYAGVDVHDKFIEHGGQQCLKVDDFVIPLLAVAVNVRLKAFGSLV